MGKRPTSWATAKEGPCGMATLVCVLTCLGFLLLPQRAAAQQFVGDNQFVAPYGVATLVATAGEEYSQAYLIAALLPEWEFNAQFTYYPEDPRDNTGSYTATNLFAKRRLSENEAGTEGYSIVGGTGLYPEHVDAGDVTNAFESWWVTMTATYAFLDDTVLLDVLPGVVLNTEYGPEDETAWGFTYSSRLAVYDVIPQSAIVGEVFGTAGEAEAEPAWRLGVRWESPKWIAALTYSDAFDGSGGAGVELGIIYFTDAWFCYRGCRSGR